MRIFRPALSALALAALISLAAACGGGSSSSTAKPAAATASARAATTSAATASPAGTWNVAYSTAPAAILGQYSITEAGGFFYITTKSVLTVPAGACSLPAGKIGRASCRERV